MIVIFSSANKLSFSALITNAGKAAKKSGWITIRGTHVKLEGGVVVAGPKALKDLVAGGKPAAAEPASEPAADVTASKPAAAKPVDKPAVADPASKPAAPGPSGRPVGVMDPKDIGKGVSSEQVDTKKSHEMAVKYKSLQNQCYANAGRVLRGEGGYTYAEGMFVSTSGQLADHAWLIDKAGKIVDPTFHEHGMYYPLIKLSKEDLGHYGEQNIDGNRIFDKMKKAGVDPGLSALQKIVFAKKNKDIKKEAAVAKGSRQQGSFDHRVLKPIKS